MDSPSFSLIISYGSCMTSEAQQQQYGCEMATEVTHPNQGATTGDLKKNTTDSLKKIFTLYITSLI